MTLAPVTTRAALAAFVGCLILALPAAAGDIIRVEEDWELVVGQPDANSTSPQITTVISPTDNLDALYSVFELNHRTQPDFVSGGIQLQVWSGEQFASSGNFPQSGVMSTADETVRWTMSMRSTSDGLWFEVVNGTSSTWGSFGGQGYLKLSGSTSLANLNGYNPLVSVEYSGAGYAANRVTSLVLKEVRLYSGDGLEATDTTDRFVYPTE